MRLLNSMVFFVFLAGPLAADERSDAKYIVEQTVNATIFFGALAAVKPVIISAFQYDLSKQGIVLSDPGRIGDILFEEFMAEFVEGMQAATLEHYLQSFSAQELSDLAEFYASPTGQVLIQKTPEMMAFGAREGARIGEIAGGNAGPRLAARLEAEGLQITEKAGMMQRLLDALR